MMLEVKDSETLLALVVELRSRGVTKFSIGEVSVEMLPALDDLIPAPEDEQDEIDGWVPGPRPYEDAK